MHRLKLTLIHDGSKDYLRAKGSHVPHGIMLGTRSQAGHKEMPETHVHAIELFKVNKELGQPEQLPCN